MSVRPAILSGHSLDGRVTAEIRRGFAEDGSEIELRVDPVSLAALAASRAAGGGTGYGALPDIDEIPLRIVVIETRLEMLEGELARRTRTGGGA